MRRYDQVSWVRAFSRILEKSYIHVARTRHRNSGNLPMLVSGRGSLLEEWADTWNYIHEHKRCELCGTTHTYRWLWRLSISKWHLLASAQLHGISLTDTKVTLSQEDFFGFRHGSLVRFSKVRFSFIEGHQFIREPNSRSSEGREESPSN